MKVNKEGTDWLLIKKWLEERIDEFHIVMEFQQPIEMYNQIRGSILLARDLLEWVEPTTPPQTEEDDYGISNP